MIAECAKTRKVVTGSTYSYFSTAAFDSNTGILAVGSGAGPIYLWDAVSGGTIGTLNPPSPVERGQVLSVPPVGLAILLAHAAKNARSPCSHRADHGGASVSGAGAHRWKAAVMVVADDAERSLGRPSSCSVVASSE